MEDLKEALPTRCRMAPAQFRSTISESSLAHAHTRAVSLSLSRSLSLSLSLSLSRMCSSMLRGTHSSTRWRRRLPCLALYQSGVMCWSDTIHPRRGIPEEGNSTFIAWMCIGMGPFAIARAWPLHPCIAAARPDTVS